MGFDMNHFLKFFAVIITALIIGIVPSLFAASQGNVKQVNDNNFASILASNQVVVMDFSADWCQPCKKFHPTFVSVAQEMRNIAAFGQVNIDHCPNTSNQCSIDSIPTVILFKNGKEVARTMGISDAQTLKTFISSNL